MKLRRFMVALVVSSACFSLTAYAADPSVFKFPHDAPEHQVGKGQTAVRFAEYVEKYSEGKLKVQVYPGAQLLQTKEEIRACARNQVQVIAPYITYLATIDPLYELFYTPMVFKDMNDAMTKFKGPIGEKLRGNLEKHGLKGIAIWHDGPIYPFMKDKPFRNPEDAQGKKIRTVPSKPAEDGLRQLGAIPISLPAPEVYLALQQGVAHGVLTTPTFAYASHWDDVLKTMTDVLMGWGGYVLCLNLKMWQGLSEEQRNIFTRAAADATAWNEVNNTKYIQDSIKGLKERGLTVHSLNKGEEDSLRKLMEPVYEKQVPELRDLIKEIRTKN